MNKKIGVALIIVVLAVVVFVSGCTQQGNNTTQNNTTVQNVTNTTNTSAKAVDVIATQSGPTTAKKGDNVTITYKVTNNGNEKVFYVRISSENFVKNVETLNPGETRTFTQQVHIPTDKEVQQDFGANATLSNPFYIGGFTVSFSDNSGSKHSILSNSISINLI